MIAETHLAVPAAEPIAAHGIVSQRALLTAVGSSLTTFLKARETLQDIETELVELQPL